MHGKTKLINHSTQDVCEFDFKEKNWNGKNA